MRTLLIALALLLGAAIPASAAPVPLEAGTPLTAPSSANRCANGYNVRGYLLVPPNCAPVGAVVSGPGGIDVGAVVAVRETYSVVRITNTTAWVQRPTIAGRTGVVTGSAETPVGGAVCAVGRSSGLRCGTVQARNVTVNFPTGTVSGLTRTTLCTDPGETWKPVFTGSQAQGHVLGGSGNCSTGGTSLFYPVNRILAENGFTLVTG
ncbi:S1 family peptidase [Saccharothrix syringae]|uniref:Peptidase S1 n=1 Tax=Saccharothrix syringae TaxID=103733 RepID=A0A5Q0H9C5_SACSY|nr:S1 family peptidase [Saccharothrix syringae]QFZ22837.1 peptidase S1 [Saccharothrix syringae]